MKATFTQDADKNVITELVIDESNPDSWTGNGILAGAQGFTGGGG